MTLKSFLAWFFSLQGAIVAAWFAVPLLLAHLAPNKPSEVSVESPPSPVIKGKPRKTVTAQVKVLETPPPKLKLPPLAPDEHVLTATQVRSSDRPQTITTTIDTSTGEARTFTKQDEYPLFAWEPRGEARLALGYKHQRGRVQEVVRLGVSYDAVRVKGFVAGVTGSVDSDGASFLGASIAYRW